MRLLLDGHISPEIANALRRRGLDAIPLKDWREAVFLPAADVDILAAARPEGLVLVTFDVASVPEQVREMARAGRSHAGVIVVSAKTFRQNDIRGLAEALLRCNAALGEVDWTDRLIFLPR